MARYSRRASSKELERLLERVSLIVAPELSGRFAFVMHRYTNGGSPAPRIELHIDGEAVWRFPDDYFEQSMGRHQHNIVGRWGSWTDDEARGLYGKFRTYLNTPRDKLLEPIDHDEYHVYDILRAADRRNGYKRLLWWTITAMPAGVNGRSNPARRVLQARFGTR